MRPHATSNRVRLLVSDVWHLLRHGHAPMIETMQGECLLCVMRWDADRKVWVEK